MMLELTLNSFACRLLQRVHAWTRASGPLTSPMKGSSSPVTLSGLPLALLARGLISKRQLIRSELAARKSDIVAARAVQPS